MDQTLNGPFLEVLGLGSYNINGKQDVDGLVPACTVCLYWCRFYEMGEGEKTNKMVGTRCAQSLRFSYRRV